MSPHKCGHKSNRLVGWTYEANEEAISQAQENLNELDIQKRQEDLEYQITQLETLKSILENLDEKRQKEANEKALKEYFGEDNPLGKDSELVSSLVSGFAASLIAVNMGTGEVKDSEGNVIATIPGISDAAKQQAEAAATAQTNLDDAKSFFKSAQDTFLGNNGKTKPEVGTDAYRKAADEYINAKKNLDEKISAAKNVGVIDEEASSYIKDYKEPKETDWLIADDISNPTEGKGTKAKGTHSVLLNTNDPLSEKDLKQFGKTDYTQIKKYNGATWGSWEKYTKAIKDLPDYTIVMNAEGTDAYAFVKDGYLYWLHEKGGNNSVKKKGTWGDDKWASGTLSTKSNGTALINELGTEAVITPGGTLTALPSKTGIVPADITRNVWALGEVAPTLVAQLSSLTQKPVAGNVGNTTYEEGQYFDHFTMNVYPAKGDDLDKILQQARAHVALTRHNN